MSRATVVVVGWAAWVTVLAAVLFVWTPSDWVEWIPFVGSLVGAWAIAVGYALVLRRRARPRLDGAPAFSPGAVLVALGLMALLQGTSLGVWLAYLGAGVLALGLGVVVRETLLVRRSRGSA